MSKDYSKYNIENERRGELFNRQKVRPDMLDKNSEFIVEDGYVAFLLLSGKAEQTLEPGRYKIFGRKDLAGHFDKKRVNSLRILFISDNKAQKEVKWGIPANEMKTQDPVSEEDFSMGAFGKMDIQIGNPRKFYEEWMTDKAEGFNIEDFQGLVLAKLKDQVGNMILRTVTEQQIPYHKFDVRKSEIAAGALKLLQPVFAEKYGIKVTDFVIGNITLPPNDLERLKGWYQANKDEVKARQKKLENKEEEREIRAELERLADKEWERDKWLRELEADNYEKYLYAMKCIGVANGSKGDKEKTKNAEDGGFCSKCGKPYEAGDAFCSKCATRLGPKKCDCGATIAKDAAFCSKCGKAL